MQNTAPLILTLVFDQDSFAFFNRQRQRYFPPERNFIPAHLTLFHHLPGAELQRITADLHDAARRQEPFPIDVTGLRSLGRGVAYTLQSPALAQLRGELAERWSDWLLPQDRQKHQPHVTFQNKVDPAEAKALLSELSPLFAPFTARAEGLQLWWYRGGPWEQAARFPFTE